LGGAALAGGDPELAPKESLIGSVPRLAFQSNDAEDDSNTSQLHNQTFKYDQQPHANQLNPLMLEPLYEKQGKTDVMPDFRVIHSVPSESPPEVFQWPYARIRNTIKRLLRPSVSVGFQRIEWICVSLS
jgi:hypothetical protein